MNPPSPTSRALLTLALAAAFAPAARADDWLVRPVRLGTSTTPYENVDVLPTPAGITLGYSLPSDSNLYLSTLPTSQSFFQHQISTTPITAASFAADPAGNIYFAAFSPTGLRVGADASAWNLGILSSPYPDSSLASPPSAPPPFSPLSLSTPTTFPPSSPPPPAASPSSPTSIPPPTPGSNKPFPSQPAKSLSSSKAPSPTPPTITPSSLTSVPQAPLLSLSPSNPTPTTGSPSPPPLPPISFGLSVASAPDGRIAVAYSSFDGLHLSTYDGSSWSDTLLSSLPSSLEPHSLSVDSTGQFALAYAPRTNPFDFAAPLHLARQSPAGQWTDQTLPLSALYASVSFDSSNHPYIGAFDGSNVLLAGTNILLPLADDFTLDGSVTSDDIPALVQAIHRPSIYLAAHPQLTTADLVAIGDRTHDLRLNNPDARAFADSISTSPVPGLPTRTSAYLAFDQADKNPLLGSGTGNFFSTILSTHKPYAPGDSRADLTGPTPGTPDGQINSADLDYLANAITHPSPSPDLRLDLNDDGQVNAADFSLLLQTILGTSPGDANADGTLNPDDYTLLDRGYAKHLTGYSNGDFNLDGSITSADYLLLDTAYLQQGGPLSPTFLSDRESQFGPAYVQSLLISIPEPTFATACLFATFLLQSRRRRLKTV